jgi:type VI secretion system secreted protein Hcp
MALFDAFLKLDGIKGESADAKHKGEIDIESFSWGMSQTGVSATGGGGGAGKVRLIDFCFTAKTNASSPLLFLNCANGAHIKEANFVVRKAGGEQLEYLKIKLTDVLVSSYKPHGAQVTGSGAPGGGGSGGGAAHAGRPSFGSFSFRPEDVELPWAVMQSDQIPTDEFSLNFAKIEFSYQPQGADGKAQGGPVMAGWDVKANQKV